MTRKADIYVGWDPRESMGYDLTDFTLRETASRRGDAIDIFPVRLDDLRGMGIYNRPPDPEATTEFTISRFFVPYLTGWNGWALFVDSDVLFIDSACDLFERYATEENTRYAVMVVKHPDGYATDGYKKGRMRQRSYPRKNWSSVVLWNCAHPSNSSKLDLHELNNRPPSYLHRFQWLRDEEIGELDPTWNHLVGYDGRQWIRDYPEGLPSLLHYTDGSPYMDGWRNGPLSDVWKEAVIRMYQRDLYNKRYED